MRGKIPEAIDYLKRETSGTRLTRLVPMDKLIITKSLRSNYKNPMQIAHKVLADRMGKRDVGNKPGPGDRIPFVYIATKDKKALQGNRIEHPQYVRDNKIKLDYVFLYYKSNYEAGCAVICISIRGNSGL